MQKARNAREEADDDAFRSSRKRKVQWADVNAENKELAIPSPSRLATYADDAVHSNSRVDEHGMLVSIDRDSDQPVSLDPSNAAQKQYLASEIYNPIEYGDFGSYMKHKRAKLKVQEASLLQEEEALLRVRVPQAITTDKQGHHLAAEIQSNAGKRSDALKGCCVYINGQTHPPYSELRRLLVLHGGDLMAYLDQKTPVTHIVASNLTPKKRIEFKDYKVVLPGWILESIELGRKADWRKWRCDANTGSNGHTSKSIICKNDGDPSTSIVPLGDWRNLDRTAKPPRQLPRIGEEDESPWGKPTNQTNLLNGFKRKQGSPTAKDLPTFFTEQSIPAPLPKPKSESSQTQRETTFKGVRFGAKQIIQPATSILSSEPTSTSSSVHLASSAATESVNVRKLHETRSHTTTKEARAPEDSIVTPTKPKGKFDSSIGTDPASKKAAIAVSRGHYASRPSNTHAARLLASPSWRERNTATSEGFLAGYFAKSRLHHLSTWKSSLQDMVSSALREAGRPLGSSDLPKGVQRVIMHIDFDSFFVAVGLKKRPDLKDKPVVVCHGTGFGLPAAKAGDENRPADNQSSSTSEIASCSYKAREFGIRNGMSLGQAKRLCSHVETIPYDFEAYNSVSLTFYTFLLEHSDALQAVSVDEALVDVSLLLQSMRDGDTNDGSLYQRYRDHLGSQGQVWTAEKQLAEAFRDEIRDRCECEASIGIGSNILLARLATRKAKPGGSFHLTDDAKQLFLNALDVDDLHGIGWSLRDRIRELFQTINIGEILSKTNKRRMMAEFGPKKGKMIWDRMHGIDADRLEGNKLRQSVGSHVNYGIRFLTEQEAENFVTGMCQEVSQRAKAVKLRGRQVSVQVMVRAKTAPVEAPKFLGHGVCDTHHRSAPVSGPGGVAIDDEARIRAAAWPLIRDLKADPKELRGIAISLNKLEPADANVLSPAKSTGGQAMLRFGSVAQSSSSKLVLAASKRSARDAEEASNASDVEQLDEPGIELPASLEKGPDAATPRRPQDTDKCKRTSNRPSPSEGSPIKMPSATQLMLPSKSQIDPDVFDALPTQYRRQIEAKLGPPRGDSLTDNFEADLVEEESPDTTRSLPQSRTGSQTLPRVLPRSTPTTPQKAKVAPSPAMAEALMLPSASQIDPVVLAELPDSVRKEIERQLGFLHHEVPSAPSSVESTPTSKTRKKVANTSTLLHFLQRDTSKVTDRHNSLFRSISESPTKERVVHRLLQSTGGHHVAPDQPAVDRDALLVMDPAKISLSQLEAVGIDAEVFQALPMDLQRETFQFHSEQKKSEKARFKAGKSSGFEELTLAEQRRRETVRAALKEKEARTRVEERLRGNRTASKGTYAVALVAEGQGDVASDPPAYLIARPKWRVPSEASVILNTANAEKSSRDIPTIRGLSHPRDVEILLSQWISAFARKGPREGDVNRIATYLADVVRTASVTRVEDTQKASSLLGFIQERLDEVQYKIDDGFASEEWETAKRKIRDAVQAKSREVFGGAELEE